MAGSKHKKVYSVEDQQKFQEHARKAAETRRAKAKASQKGI